MDITEYIKNIFATFQLHDRLFALARCKAAIKSDFMKDKISFDQKIEFINLAENLYHVYHRINAFDLDAKISIDFDHDILDSTEAFPYI